MGGERMSRGPTFSPTPSHRAMQGYARTTPSPYTDVDEFGPSPFVPEDASPSMPHPSLPPAFDGGLVSPELLTHAPLDLAHFHPQHQHPLPHPHAHPHAHAQPHPHPHAHYHAPHANGHMPQLVRGHSVPMLTHRVDAQHAQAFLPFGRMQQPGPAPPGTRVHPPPQRMQPQRHNSMQPQRADSPHFISGDVFGHDPHVRPATAIGMNMAGPSRAMGYEYPGDMYVMPQGISPARAMGPAPAHPPRFSPGGIFDPHRTPTQQHASAPQQMPSSATSITTATTRTSDASSTSSSVRTVRNRRALSSSDGEEDSPTKATIARLPTTRAPLERADTIEVPVRNALPPKKPALVPSAPPPKPVRPLVKPAVSAGRTSAKFAKVAEDPGVEGIPPGPRPMERPGPSFACIIGQAILRSSAGGLSLEHIYRYVETAYPFFKSGDGAWRNSVRHNLSIHKMFETIPRTEKFPPGKGGIWIIHDDEKCHWPEEDKFIKNFPSTHQHHAVCRQTLHERAKEQEARDKAAREGKVYVPKKGKKGRKGPSKDDGEDDSGTDMGRSSSFGVGGLSLQRSHSTQSIPGSMPPPRMLHPPPMAYRQTLPSSPPQALMANSFDFDDDGDFVPVESSEANQLLLATPVEPASTPVPAPHAPAYDHMMGPPRIERRDKRVVSDDEENVFTAGPKRVRMAEPAPLSPIDPHPQPNDLFNPDDMYITPARERSGQAPHTSARNSLGSSAFKTPALVQTSSSPNSSPMPPTVTRGPAHLPSSLQQAWTHDDMMASGPGTGSSPAGGLDAAFDLKPRARKPRISDDDLPPPAAPHFGRGPGGANGGHATSSPPPARVPPKTPVTRSSAGAGVTPRVGLRTPGITTKTPLFCGSPGMGPPTNNAHLSTPLWEMGGILERMNSYAPESPLRTPRSPVPSTDPTRYSILLDSGASPKPRREFSV
ncbi:Forkhead transcription factor [Cryptotrichosporon argae]